MTNFELRAKQAFDNVDLSINLTEDIIKDGEKTIQEAHKMMQSNSFKEAEKGLQKFNVEQLSIASEIKQEDNGLRAIPIIGTIINTISPRDFNMLAISEKVDEVFSNLSNTVNALEASKGVASKYIESLEKDIDESRKKREYLESLIEEFDTKDDIVRKRFLDSKNIEAQNLLALENTRVATKIKLETQIESARNLTNGIKTSSKVARAAIDNLLVESAGQSVLQKTIDAQRGIIGLVQNINERNNEASRRGAILALEVGSACTIDPDSLLNTARELESNKKLYEQAEENQRVLSQQNKRKLQEAADILSNFKERRDVIIDIESVEVIK